MEYDNDLIWSILEALEKVEPDNVEHHSKILPDYEDQEKVRKHVLHCKNEGWIDFKVASARDSINYMFVKIIKPGREYLKMMKSKKDASKKGVDENLKTDPKKVFVVHGRNKKAKDGMFGFLRAIGLNPIEWNQAIKSTGKASPFTGEVLDKTFEEAPQAVIVLITGDDIARLKDCYIKENDPDYEKEPTPQARPNVLFEAGLAFGKCADRTLIVVLEKETTRPFSDISGRHIVRLSNNPKSRKDLIDRLQTAGCEIDIEGKTDWLETGDFEGVIDRNLAQDELSEVKPSNEEEIELTEDQLFILALIAESDESGVNLLFRSYKRQFPEANLVKIKYIANMLKENELIVCIGAFAGSRLYVATEKGIERAWKESEIMEKYEKAIEEHKEMLKMVNKF